MSRLPININHIYSECECDDGPWSEWHYLYRTAQCTCPQRRQWCGVCPLLHADFLHSFVFTNLFGGSVITQMMLIWTDGCNAVRRISLRRQRFLSFSLSPHNVKSGAMKCIRRQVAHRQATTRPTKNQFHSEWHILYMRSIAAAAIYWWWNIQRERRWGNSKIKKEEIKRSSTACTTISITNAKRMPNKCRIRQSRQCTSVWCGVFSGWHHQWPYNKSFVVIIIVIVVIIIGTTVTSLMVLVRHRKLVNCGWDTVETTTKTTIFTTIFFFYWTLVCGCRCVRVCVFHAIICTHPNVRATILLHLLNEHRHSFSVEHIHHRAGTQIKRRYLVMFFFLLWLAWLCRIVIFNGADVTLITLTWLSCREHIHSFSSQIHCDK